jgi:hypothetical protein
MWITHSTGSRYWFEILLEHYLKRAAFVGVLAALGVADDSHLAQRKPMP